ncbi:MAG TPA: hypothetical protein VFA99_03030, partial [Acidobacteriaceae bacterium]|nr:hypothetical protein [Acidobacteriaceae bacterium]
MPKIVDYPRASLRSSLELAAAVDALGGSCTDEMCAQRMSRKHGSGAFNSLINAAVKHGLVDSKRGNLSTTPLYSRDYKHAYSDTQRMEALRRAFLNVPLFKRIHERFVGKALPEDILDKLLIREFEVPEDLARRV